MVLELARGELALLLQDSQPLLHAVHGEPLEGQVGVGGVLRRRSRDVGLRWARQCARACSPVPTCDTISCRQATRRSAGVRVASCIGSSGRSMSWIPATTVSISSRWVGKKCRSDPVLTPARAATARTLNLAVGSSPSMVAAAMRILSRVLRAIGLLTPSGGRRRLSITLC